MYISLKKSKVSLLIMLISLICLSLTQPPLLQSVPASEQEQESEQGDILTRIKKAHIPSEVGLEAFRSYRLNGCVFIQPIALPKEAIKTLKSCIKEETGFFDPSFAYVKVVVGTTQMTQLINLEEGKGWQITDRPMSGSTKSTRSVSELQKPKYEAVAQNARYSLLGLLAVLNHAQSELPAVLESSSSDDFFVLTWSVGTNKNEYFFNKQTLLCEKQVRTTDAGKGIINYSNYKNVSNVMLPFTISIAKEDGTPVATRQIDSWHLGITWPSGYFDPNNVGSAVQ